MKHASTSGQQELLSQAIEKLRAALDLLDRAAAPAQIGAHVDLAIHQLAEAIAGDAASAPESQIDRNADPQ